MKKVIICILLVFFPFLAIAKKPLCCNHDMVSHADSIKSIQIKTDEIEKKIKDEINKQGKKYNINIDFYKSQRKSIFEKCSIYNTLGGQRAELLENQCELDEVFDFYNFIKTYMVSVDNS